MSAPRVFLIGAGGLGSPLALGLLESFSALTLSLCDPDRVEVSNLPRQILHAEADLGRLKVDSAADRLLRRADAARSLTVTRHAVALNTDNAATLLRGHDLIFEGSDDLRTKFLVNDLALRLGIPAVIGGVTRFRGQVCTVLPGRDESRGCYRCLFEEPPPADEVASCQAAGVLGPACGFVAGLMLLEALRILAGRPPRLAGAVLVVDLQSLGTRPVRIPRRADCPACALI